MKRHWRWLRVVLTGLLGLLALLLLLTFLSTDQFRAFGAGPTGSVLARNEASPHFVAGRFENAEPTEVMVKGASMTAYFRELLFGGQQRSPSCPLPMVGDALEQLAIVPASGLRITWLGHSTTLIEIDGAVLLTDPNWSEHSSPSRWVGPTRFHPPPIAIEDLPALSAVLISHEHFDHLDMESVRALSKRGVPFHVPLGVAAHLKLWGVPDRQIVQQDWWESRSLPNGVRIVSTPARHFNGRGVPGRTGTFWTSWSLVGPSHRVFFSGDTGLTEGFREVARREGPFDVALLEVGQFHASWGQIHLGPDGALEAHAMLGAKVLIPIHWATFMLGFHGWSEPVETLYNQAKKRGVTLLTPGLAQPVEPTVPTPTTAWWRALPPIAARCP